MTHKAVAKNVKNDLNAVETRLDEFYTVTKLQMDVKKKAGSEDDKENKEEDGEAKADEGRGKGKEAAEGKGKGAGKGKGPAKGKKPGPKKEIRKGRKEKEEGNEETKGGKKGEKGKQPKITVQEEKDVVHVKDVKAFVDFIIAERKLDPAKTIVRVGLDGGQDSFKIVASIFDDANAEDDDGDEADAEEIGRLSSKRLNTGFS